MAKVVLKNINKIFSGNIAAVKNFNLEIEDKEFIVFLGPSGSGKSTILRIIAGLEEMFEGEVYIDDILMNNIPPKSRDIAIVFQNYALYPHMKVYDNLAFALRLRKIPPAEIDRRVEEVSKILGIEYTLNRLPKELSGGEQQRVALGRSIVRNPKVFLFDEPLSNLDAKMRTQMRIEIIKLHQRLQTTMIYVTHDQVEAMTMGERILVMAKGIIQQVDTPKKIYQFPINKFVAGFIGSPPMNFFLGKIIKKTDIFCFDGKGLNITIPEKFYEKIKFYEDKNIYLGIRPEHIILTPNGGIPAIIDVQEQMGNETLLHLRIDENLFLCRRFEYDEDIKINQEVKISFNENKIHFFDLDTEKII